MRSCASDARGCRPRSSGLIPRCGVRGRRVRKRNGLAIRRRVGSRRRWWRSFARPGRKRGSKLAKTTWQVAAVAAAAAMLLTTGGPCDILLAGSARQIWPESELATAMNGAASNGAQDGFGRWRKTRVTRSTIRVPYAGDGRAVEDDAIVTSGVAAFRRWLRSAFPVGDVNGAESVPVELMVSEDGHQRRFASSRRMLRKDARQGEANRRNGNA